VNLTPEELNRMSKNAVYTLRCSRNCELNSVLVHAEALSRLQRTGSWLCDVVSKIVLMRELSTVKLALFLTYSVLTAF